MGWARGVDQSVVALRSSTPRYAPRAGHDVLPKTAKYGSGQPPGKYYVGFSLKVGEAFVAVTRQEKGCRLVASTLQLGIR